MLSQHAPLAQLAEQLTLNQRVGGSSPSRRTTGSPSGVSPCSSQGSGTPVLMAHNISVPWSGPIQLSNHARRVPTGFLHEAAWRTPATPDRGEVYGPLTLTVEWG